MASFLDTWQRVGVKRVLMDELTALGAGNVIVFKIINRVDRSDDPEQLIADIEKAVRLLVDAAASIHIAEKIREQLLSYAESSG